MIGEKEGVIGREKGACGIFETEVLVLQKLTLITVLKSTLKY